MANEEKIRILDEQPVENAGSLLHIRTLAGSSDASKPTSLLANGSIFIETDTGKVFIFDEDNGWTEMQAGGGVVEKFLVTLTPTALDYSGTMDKTPQEITEAYIDGQKIVFDIPTMSARADADQYINFNDNIRFGAKVFYELNGSPVLITIVTNGTDDTQTYDTGIYSLTPAS